MADFQVTIKCLEWKMGNKCKALKLRSGNKLPKSYKVLERKSMEELGNQCIGEENKNGWLELKNSVSQPTPTKYVPKI